MSGLQDDPMKGTADPQTATTSFGSARESETSPKRGNRLMCVSAANLGDPEGLESFPLSPLSKGWPRDQLFNDRESKVRADKHTADPARTPYRRNTALDP